MKITGEPAPPRHGHFRGEIQFGPGTSHGSVTATVAPGDWDEWSFRAASGQFAHVVVKPGGVATFNLYAPNGDRLVADMGGFEGILPADGLYTIEVGPTGATTDYTLILEIFGDPAQPPEGHFRGEIRFAPGTDSGTVAGEVASNDWDEWSFRAGAGQPTYVRVLGPATFSLYAPDGTPLATDTTSFTGTLPADGSYKVAVGSAGGATYQLYLQIT